MEGDLIAVLAEASRFAESATPAAVAWMVDVRGSGPQVVGARLVLGAGERFVGTVGGGAIEASVLRDAAHARDESRAPAKHAYRLAAELGMCCGGTMEVLIEPVRRDEAALWRALAHVEARGGALAMAVSASASAPIGAKVIVDLEGVPVGSTLAPDAGVTHALAAAAREALAACVSSARHPEPTTVEFAQGADPSETLRVYVEVFEGPRRFVLFGAGHVAKPLARLAKMLGYHVVVVDDRADWASAVRFPDADSIVHEPYVDYLFRFEPRANDTLVIVTRGHEHDQELLRRLVDQPSRYLGMIGSRAKVKRAFQRLEASLVPKALIDRVHAPIGLNLGAQTPEEIAVAVAAELVALRRGRARPPATDWWRESN